jgi:hypothetical protein
MTGSSPTPTRTAAASFELTACSAAAAKERLRISKCRSYTKGLENSSKEVQKMIVPTIVVVQSEDGGETSSVQITTTTTTTTTSLSAGCTPSCVKSSQMVRQASEINKSLLSPSGGGETHCNYNNVDSTSQLDQEEDVDLAQPIASLASIISS